MIYARYISETRRWALLAGPDDEESLFHLEPDGSIWMLGGGQRALAYAIDQPVSLPGLEESPTTPPVTGAMSGC